MATLGCSGPRAFSWIASARLKSGFGCRVVGPGVVQPRQAAKTRGYVGMFRPQNLLLNRQRAFQQRFGCRVVALDTVKLRQVVQARGYVGMLRPQNLLPHRQRALQQRLGFRVLALSVIQPRQVVQARGQAWILWPKGFRLLQGSLELLFGLGVTTFPIGLSSCLHVGLPVRRLRRGELSREGPQGERQQTHQQPTIVLAGHCDHSSRHRALLAEASANRFRVLTANLLLRTTPQHHYGGAVGKGQQVRNPG